ncbi:GntR family transcriptional regulator [Arthrobacter sp. NEB 688]|uniref:GntR family transcriptional regulator n=1 Tax=Arthrobacter sp. NEB 688 TaxID=904039 RepID=UPI001567BBED|nr:GntR family transcriptional regulator [Arthrobacter sp. NEB 688]QKE82901.1 GntR family transcriptional regulator [Arthrobacter sp. NEB 688]
MALTIVNRTLREQVLDQLRAAILDGTFAPGHKLAEVDLAAEFGVSRGTVREALRALQNSGLVEGAGRLSLRVRRLGAREIAELYEVRAALEGQAVVAVLAAPDAAELVADLERRLPEAGAGASAAERFELDLGWHEALCRASGNATLVAMWSSIKDLMRITVLAAPEEAAAGLMARSHHQPIVDALKGGDPDVARRVLSAHMAAAATGLREQADDGARQEA